MYQVKIENTVFPIAMLSMPRGCKIASFTYSLLKHGAVARLLQGAPFYAELLANLQTLISDHNLQEVVIDIPVTPN